MKYSPIVYKIHEQGIILNFLKRNNQSFKEIKPSFSAVIKDTREDLLISKAELARKAGVSPLTINRVENGLHCRTDTRRKIIFALGRYYNDTKRHSQIIEREYPMGSKQEAGK